jgi:peptidase S41-like protein
MRVPSIGARCLLLLAMVLPVLLGTKGLHAQSNEGPRSAVGRFDYQPWLDDFHQLLGAMESHYADLEWAVRERHMDLPKLRQETEEKLRLAKDAQAEEQVLEQFLEAFGDPHLKIKWPAAKVDTAPSRGSGSVEPLCTRLGYKDPQKKGIDFSALPDFSEVTGDGADSFPGGLLTVNNTKVGVLRIASFTEQGFPLACESTVRDMRLDDDSACDADCPRGDIALEAGNRLTEAIVRRAQQLRALGASALLIDITHNGGGDDWNEAVARSLSPIPLVYEEHTGFIKHPAWTAILQDRLQKVESDLNTGAEQSQILTQAALLLRKDIGLSKETCDRSRVFDDGILNCSLVVDGGLFWSGVLPYAKPGSFPKLQSRKTLFGPLQYKYTESSHRLPLIVAVDVDTYSSAERFAALLQDNKAATVIGELTGGAGCGYVNEGIPTTLANSDAQVKMPDCVGFRKDGSNANDGVSPDIYVPWQQRDTPYTRADKLRAGLEKLVSRTTSAPTGRRDPRGPE